METELDSQKKLKNTTTATDEIFTISRYIANYIFIAIIFFVIGGIVGVIGYSSNVTRNEDLIQSAVDAAYIRQAETLNELVESGVLSGEVRPNASQFEDDDPSIGPEDAPVVIVEFSDFNCSFCKRFHDSTLQPLLDQYEGQIRFIYRDFAILGETSVTSAIASECADDQGQFWEYHDLLFANQGSFSRDNLIGYAESLDLDLSQFTTCLDERTYFNEVRADSAAAQQIGASGTPAFMINGQFISGAQPFEVFAQIIEAELTEALQE